mmetsp:Transcript_70962/g.178978  ORF Transcript_70962/g.178978 Transcript_70962/m.178978 type:complete len:202 (-) Transcript_70962:107-712(-)
MKRVKRGHNLVALCDLHSAVAGGNACAVLELLQAGASVNEADEFGTTPLHRAAWQDDLPIFRLLLAHGADISAARSGDGRTAQSLAELRLAGAGRDPPIGLSAEPVTSHSSEEVNELISQESARQEELPLAAQGSWSSSGFSPPTSVKHKFDRASSEDAPTSISLASISTMASEFDDCCRSQPQSPWQGQGTLAGADVPLQ